jgi:hypothetical protein
MSTDSPAQIPQRPVVKHVYRNGGDAIYAVGIIGAAVYFIEHATTVWMGALGLLKAVFWPGLVVYRVMELLNL